MALLQDFGVTYWGYDSNGTPKYDSASRAWTTIGNSGKTSSSYYADVIGKMTGVEGNKGNVLRFYLFFDGRTAPTFDAHLGRDSITGLTMEVGGSPYQVSERHPRCCMLVQACVILAMTGILASCCFHSL